jgi:hypothetical protein
VADDQHVLVRRAGSPSWTNPETSAYDNEAHLQSLLVQDPSRIPGVNRQAVAVDELSTSGGPVDVCIVDVDGSLTVVECKLASNSERRRMVIGQVIDYASAIWMDGVPVFLSAWALRGGADLSEALSPDALATLETNIGEARINLCLAVDAINQDLRRLVEYLNQVTLDQVRVTALQLSYARHGDLEILIPSTFGGEIAAVKARGDKTPWTRQSFLDALVSDSDRELAAWYLDKVEATYDQRRGDSPPVWYGTHPRGGLFLHPHGLRYAPLQLWVNTKGRLTLFGNWTNWSTVTGHDGFADLARLLGQDHHSGRSRSVQAEAYDRDAVWAEVLKCAEAVNIASS